MPQAILFLKPLLRLLAQHGNLQLRYWIRMVTLTSPMALVDFPFTMSGIAGIFGITPSSGADPQDWKYLTDSAPGSYSRKMYNQRTCNPLWNTQGCKTDPAGDSGGVTTAPEATANAGSQAWYNKFFGFFNSDTENISGMVEPTTTSYRGLIVPCCGCGCSWLYLLRRIGR